MVGTLVRLKFKLLFRAPGNRTMRLIGQLVIGLYLLAAVGALSVGLVVLRGSSLPLRGALVTLGFSLLSLLWPLLTLMVAGADATLDPGRFALFPVRARQLMPGLLVIGLIGLGGICTLVLALMYVVSWSASTVQALSAVLGMLLGVPSCLLMARALTSWFTRALNSRRYRDTAALVLGLLGMVSGLGVQAVMRGIGTHGNLTEGLTSAARVAGWTPLGWAWALPWEAGRGAWASLAVHLLLAMGWVGLLWRTWQVALERALVSPLEAGGGGGRAKAHSVVDRMVPATPAGAVAGRSLRYWRRDPRHLVQAAGVLLMPVLVLAPRMMNPADGQATSLADNLWVPVFTIVLMGSLVMAQETSYDGTALWMHASAGIRGRDDRLGRVIAFCWLFVPMATLLALAFTGLGGVWGSLPPLLGTCWAALGVSMAVGCVTGAIWQVPQPPPGQGALARSSGGGVESLLMTFVSLLVAGIGVLPVAVAGMLAGSRPWLGWLVLLVGPVYGALAAWGGIRWGGRLLERSWPEVLAKVSTGK